MSNDGYAFDFVNLFGQFTTPERRQRANFVKQNPCKTKTKYYSQHRLRGGGSFSLYLYYLLPFFQISLSLRFSDMETMRTPPLLTTILFVFFLYLSFTSFNVLNRNLHLVFLLSICFVLLLIFLLGFCECRYVSLKESHPPVATPLRRKLP